MLSRLQNEVRISFASKAESNVSYQSGEDEVRSKPTEPVLFAHNVIALCWTPRKWRQKGQHNTYLLGFPSGYITLQRTNRRRGGCFEAWETPGYVEIDMGYEMQRHGHLYKIHRFKDSKTWHPSQA